MQDTRQSSAAPPPPSSTSLGKRKLSPGRRGEKIESGRKDDTAKTTHTLSTEKTSLEPSIKTTLKPVSPAGIKSNNHQAQTHASQQDDEEEEGQLDVTPVKSTDRLPVSKVSIETQAQSNIESYKYSRSDDKEEGELEEGELEASPKPSPKSLNLQPNVPSSTTHAPKAQEADDSVQVTDKAQLTHKAVEPAKSTPVVQSAPSEHSRPTAQDVKSTQSLDNEHVLDPRIPSDSPTKPTPAATDSIATNQVQTPALEPTSHAQPAQAHSNLAVVPPDLPVDQDKREPSLDPPSNLSNVHSRQEPEQVAETQTVDKVAVDTAQTSPGRAAKADIIPNHVPTSPLTEIQPSSPARLQDTSLTRLDTVQEDVEMDERLPSAIKQHRPSSPRDIIMASIDDETGPETSRGNSRRQSPTSQSITPRRSSPAATTDERQQQQQQQQQREPVSENEESPDEFGKEFIDFDPNVFKAVKNLFMTHQLQSADAQEAVNDVLAENLIKENAPVSRLQAADQYDSWAIARRVANIQATRTRHIVALRTAQAQEYHQKYIKALQDEWDRLDKDWQIQRKTLEEENEHLKKEAERAMRPPTPAVAEKDTSRPAPRNRRRGGPDNDEMLGIHDGDEAGLERILLAIRQAEEADPIARAKKTEAVIPDMVIDPSGYKIMFDDNTSLVQDPLTFYDMEHRTDVPFSKQEDSEFRRLYNQFPKKFGEIADRMPGRSPQECVNHYYHAKKRKPFKEQVRGFKVVKEVPVAPRKGLVGMVRGRKVVADNGQGKGEGANSGTSTPAATGSRKSAKKKQQQPQQQQSQQQEEATKASKPVIIKADANAPPKVRKKPGPKPGTKRKASTAAGELATTLPGTSDIAGSGTMPPKKKRVTKPKVKKGPELPAEHLSAVGPTASGEALAPQPLADERVSVFCEDQVLVCMY